MHIEIGKNKEYDAICLNDGNRIEIYCAPIWKYYNTIRKFTNAFIKTVEHEMLHQQIGEEFGIGRSYDNYRSKISEDVEESCVRTIMKEKRPMLGGGKRKMKINERKENVRVFKENCEDYVAVIMPRHIVEYFIHYKEELVKDPNYDFKFDSLAHYLYENHETTLTTVEEEKKEKEALRQLEEFFTDKDKETIKKIWEEYKHVKLVEEKETTKEELEELITESGEDK